MGYNLSDEVVCLSYFYAKPECRDQLITELLKIIPSTRAEPGCLQYELVLDKENPNFLFLVEKYVNQQSFDEHERQPYIKNFLENFMNKYCEKISWNEGREIQKCR